MGMLNAGGSLHSGDMVIKLPLLVYGYFPFERAKVSQRTKNNESESYGEPFVAKSHEGGDVGSSTGMPLVVELAPATSNTIRGSHGEVGIANLEEDKQWWQNGEV